MPDRGKKFHEFALKSILFKGRTDWYFCYLKTERIAHVLALLAARTNSPEVKDIAMHAQSLPADIARLASGEVSPAAVVAEVFGLLSALRLLSTNDGIHPDNAQVLVREYEQVAERLSTGSHPSPFVGPEDFITPDVSESPLTLRPRFDTATPPPAVPKAIKDIKGQPKGQDDRMSLILSYIRKQKGTTGRGSSIKEIAAVVKGCSEKTVQRQLNTLIEQGLVRRLGERRWSTYEAI